MVLVEHRRNAHVVGQPSSVTLMQSTGEQNSTRAVFINCVHGYGCH